MISVLLPTFNSKNTIKKSVDNILKQSFHDFELLILDDGSIDGTENIIMDITDHRIHYHKFEHKGLTKTLNSGLALAKYDIIARMDADDLCVPWRFEQQLKVLQNLPENVLLSSWSAVFDKGKIQFIVKTPIESEQIKKGLLLHSYLSHPGLMFYKKTLIENGGYRNEVEIDAFQDYETWLKIKENVEFAIIPEVLIFLRYRMTSLSNNLLYKQKIIYSIQEPYYKNMREHFNLKTIAEENLYRGWREYFYGAKKKARVFWTTIEITSVELPKIIIAWFITFLPESLFLSLKEARIKFRFKYYLKFFSKEMRSLRNSFNECVKEN